MPKVFWSHGLKHREEADRVFRQLTDKTVLVERHSTGWRLRCGTKEHRRCGPTRRDKAAAEEDAHRVADCPLWPAIDTVPKSIAHTTTTSANKVRAIRGGVSDAFCDGINSGFYISRRLVLKRPADFPSSECCGQWSIEISRVWLLNFRQLCPNLTRLLDLADQKKTYGSSEAGHSDVSTQLIQIDCLWAYHGFFVHAVSAQVMMLVYGTWTTDMPRSKKFCGATGGLNIHSNWNIHHRILIYVPQTYHHMTIHTHNHAPGDTRHHTCTQTHPPSPLHHSHTSSSLLAFLCSV